VLSGNLRSRLPLVAFGASTSIWPGAGTESDIVNKAELRARFPDPGKNAWISWNEKSKHLCRRL